MTPVATKRGNVCDLPPSFLKRVVPYKKESFSSLIWSGSQRILVQNSHRKICCWNKNHRQVNSSVALDIRRPVEKVWLDPPKIYQKHQTSFSVFAWMSSGFVVGLPWAKTRVALTRYWIKREKKRKSFKNASDGEYLEAEACGELGGYRGITVLKITWSSLKRHFCCFLVCLFVCLFAQTCREMNGNESYIPTFFFVIVDPKFTWHPRVDGRNPAMAWSNYRCNRRPRVSHEKIPRRRSIVLVV